jgi:trehalose 6-phosphate synthase/phosphatase
MSGKYLYQRLIDWVQQDYTSQSTGQEVPVTPGVHQSGGQTEYFENRPSTSSDKAPFDPQGATPGPRWNDNTYTQAEDQSEGISLIRKLAKASLAGKSDITDDPTQQHPELSLSGRIISATFNVPYSIGFSPGNEWVRVPNDGLTRA